MSRTRTALQFVACAALVAYLSFIPFRFQPLAFEEALAQFARIRYLDLGTGSRADWVANILMFVPLGWLAAAFVRPHPGPRLDPLAIAMAGLAGGAIALAVEFGQLHFAGRTVSQNDLIAEAIGTLLGACLWTTFGTHGREWWQRLLKGGRATARAALGGYVLAYLVLSLSPFDFMFGADEIAEKAASNLYGWWLAPVSCGPTPCSVKLLTELLAVAPFGWWLAMHRGDRRGSVAAAALAGFSLGVILEALQFLLVSGTSQGASIVVRMAGIAMGAWAHARRTHLSAFDWTRWGRLLVLAGLLPYLGVVAYIGGWTGGRWLGYDAGLARLDTVQWLPFFYQYFSTEQALIRSTLVHLVAYAPVGAAAWLWAGRGRGSPGVAALLAAALAFVAESGKLFIAEKHPDYTDVLFAACAAWATATVLRWASVKPTGGTSSAGPQRNARVDADARQGNPLTASVDAVGAPAAIAQVSWPSRAVGAMLLAVAAISVAGFPLWQAALGVGLLAYSLTLLRWPTAYVLVVPMALPLMDLAPWSGRFFWDEYDFLLLTTIGVRLLTALSTGTAAMRAWPSTLLMLSVLASLAVALWPPAPLDANAFTSYLSPYNGLRVAKGYLWAGLVLWLVAADVAAGRLVERRLCVGLALGLLAAATGVFAERALFVGPFDFSTAFRAAGFVSSTHVGGAYLEAMLVAFTPFALACMVSSSRNSARTFWFAVSLLGAFALLMTLSRAAFAAWLLVSLSFLLLWGFRSRPDARSGAPRIGRWVAGAAIIVLVLVGGALAQSSALRDRLALSGADLPVRLAQWRDSLASMRTDLLHLAVGVGLGSFPREFYLVQAAPMKLASYRLARETGDAPPRHLALIGGRAMYVDQRIDVRAARELRLSGRIRASKDDARLAVGLCEKSLLASVGCQWSEVRAGYDWQRFELKLTLPAEATRRFAAPLALSLHNGAFGTRIDVAQLSLAEGSRELLANGSFEQGLDRWFMHSDAHLAWRAHNSWLQIFFEQGLLGAAAWLAAGLALVIAAVRSGVGSSAGAAALAAAAGVFIVGCFDTLFDSPRMIVMTALVGAAAGVGWAGVPRPSRRKALG